MPTISARRPIMNTGIFDIEEIDLVFANGKTRRYQRLLGSRQGAVLIVPLVDESTVLLIREYAAGMERYELAFPKGKIEVEENPLTAANREMQEEIGYAARNLELLTSVTVAPGYLRHTTHIILARDLYPQKLVGDEPEEIEVVPWKIADFDQLLSRSDFTEARSITAFFMVRDRFSGRGSFQRQNSRK